jgi:hypothetical protein
MKILLHEEKVLEILALLRRIEINTVRCPDTESQFRRIRELLEEG